MRLDDSLRFAALFDGRKDAYGLGHGEVVREPLTARAYHDHLSGLEPSIGVFPLRDDGTVRFAAIDLDEPNFDLAFDLATMIPGAAFVERSKSANAHVWVFFDGPCPAWVARGQLQQALDAVGRPNVEVFPKQSELLPGMLGNYINLPLHGHDRPIINPTMRFAPSGYLFSLEEFLDLAEAGRIDPEHWLGLCRLDGIEPPAPRGEDSDFGERSTVHECATYMLEHKDDNPLTDGHRHVVLFNLAKMFLNCRHYDAEETYSIVQAFNEAGTDPLRESEIRTIVQNAERGGYTSTGCDDPIMAPYVSPTCPIANG